MPRKTLIWIGLASTLGFGYLAMRGVHLDDVATALQATTYWWLAPALAVLALSIFLRAVRWRVMYLAAVRPPLGPVTEALVIGYLFNNILPARAGRLVG